MKTLPILICLLITSSVYAGEIQSRVYERGSNIYLMSDGKEVQLTALGKDSHAVLSPDGQQVVFVRQVQELKDNPMGFPEDDAAMLYAAWSPYEIWTMDIKGKKPKVLRKSHYEKDAKKSTGWFYDLNFSPDAKTIYYACQPGSPGTCAIHSMNSDGTDDKWVCWGQGVDVVGGGSKYHGYLVVNRKADDGSYDITVLMTPEGKELEKITGEFWKKHKKVV